MASSYGQIFEEVVDEFGVEGTSSRVTFRIIQYLKIKSDKLHCRRLGSEADDGNSRIG